MIQMIQSNEHKDYQIKTINSQIQIILQELQPKSIYNTQGQDVNNRSNNTNNSNR